MCAIKLHRVLILKFFLLEPSGPMVLLNSKRRPGNKDQPINVFVIIDQFCCITKNSQTGKGSSPMI
jgi:hypothetical protein